MGYNLDLHRISVHRYREILRKQNLLPGRRILLENLDANFHQLTAAGIQTLAELKNSLSTRQRLLALSARTGVPEDYLTILRREVGSLEQKPAPLSDFPGVSIGTVSALSKRGIRTSRDLWELAANLGDLHAASREMGIEASELEELACLSDLVRINGVGPLAAKTIYEGGYRSVIEVAHASAADLLESMNAVNENKKIYKARLGVKDLQFVVDAASLILEADLSQE